MEQAKLQNKILAKETERDNTWLSTRLSTSEKEHKIKNHPRLLQRIIDRHFQRHTARHFYRYYAKVQIDKMVAQYYNDMKFNKKDFIYENPSQIKQRKKAMEYYARCIRIKKAKKLQKESGEPQTVTVG